MQSIEEDGMAQARAWLITGCSSGFGKVLAQKALKRGDRVAVTARNPKTLEHFRERFGDKALPLRLDVTDPAQVRAAVAETVAAFGRIDVLVNNAGYGLQCAAEEATEAQIRDLFEVNFFGALDLIRAALPRMREQGSGAHIVNISSVGGRLSAPLIALYSASKWALEGLSVGLAAELAGFGIRVTTIEPGAFATGFADAIQPPQARLTAYAAAHAFTESMLADMVYADPAGCAEAILAAVDAPEPPRQLVVGGQAYAWVEQAIAAQTEELAKWQATSVAADG
jgi:NAD(P)-dependent dehydrogenase (short-subunit alcohol dehydrogenase family)